ncbi:hypothetical protein [Flammeovirga sp. OC4]|uniref:hypothetical protein n=1 Tax=Flammeovirga sp. OC4 TaxID=1382345 RepID=UPI0005C60224|nr:hypothetical protein [Flammeovirga sp. OC4]
MDFKSLKTELKLTSQQNKAFQVVEKEYILKRKKLIQNSNLNKDAENNILLRKLKNSYKDQERELYYLMDEHQQHITHQFIKKHMPGQFHYADDVRTDLVELLSLDSYQKRQYKAINITFDKIYLKMNRSDFDYKQHVTSHWYQLEVARKNAIQKVFTKEQFQYYQEVIQRVNYEHS